MRTAKLLSWRRRPLILNALAALTLALVAACSGGGSEPTPAPASTPVPPATESPVVAPPAPAPTALPPATPTPAPTPAPTPVPAPTATPAPPTPTPGPSPTPTSTPPPTPTPTPPPSNTFDTFGFTLQLDQDATFASSNFQVNGLTGTEASEDQGLVTFAYNGADVVLFWQPMSGDSPQAVVDSTYELLKLGRPGFNFTPINEGDLAVDGKAGRFGGFVSADASGGNADGGLIGAWTCPNTGTAMSLTVTGPDATALQIRFDRLTSGFQCGS